MPRDDFGSRNLTLAMNNLRRSACCAAGCLSGLVIRGTEFFSLMEKSLTREKGNEAAVDDEALPS